MASRKLVRSSKTQNPIKKRDNKRNSDDRLADLPEWLEEFKENLVDTYLRNQIQNIQQKWQRNQGSTVLKPTS